MRNIYLQRENIIRWSIVAGIVIAVVILIVVIFGSISSSASVSDTADAGEKVLVEMTGKNAIRMTVRGKIVADEDFKSYEITLKPHVREMKVLSGYNGEKVLAETSHKNSWDAYTEASYALKRLGMMKGKALVGDKDDTRGICPDGELTVFEVLDGERVVKRLWRTSCRDAKGSFRGDYKKVSGLVTGQIPDYTAILSEAEY